MSKISIKKDFVNGDKLFSADLNNNFRVIEAGINANEENLQQVINEAIVRLDAELLEITANRGWDWNTGERVIYFKGTATQLEQREIINGQILVNSDTGGLYVDTNNQRKSIEDAPLANLTTRVANMEDDLSNLESNVSTLEGKLYTYLNESNIDNLKDDGNRFYHVFNASGTLPTGYTGGDNDIFLEVYFVSSGYGRQILFDGRSNKVYIRACSSNTWGAWSLINTDINITSGTSNPSGGNDGDIYFKYS